MEQEAELDRETKEIDLLFNQHISKGRTVNALNIQELVDMYIQRFQNQLIKIKRVGQLVETKDEADLGKRITSFIN
ncbi:hypothetical protein MKW92_010378, partial [Papaver armeniacum]